MKRCASASALRSIDHSSDSAYLLDLLGFELLLKLVVEATCHIRAPTHHRYAELFTLLALETQDDILRLAAERIGPSTLVSDCSAVLKDLGTNFISLRYPYEKYSHMTEAEYQAAGDSWIEAGGDIAAADFRFHAEELLGLIHALEQVSNGC